MKNIIPLILAVFGIIYSSSCNQKSQSKLRIATSSNMQFVMKEIVSDFEQESGIPCEVVIGSSGNLTAQILQGGPFDVLASADIEYCKKIQKAGFGYGEIKPFAKGSLVMCVKKDYYEKGQLSSSADDLSLLKKPVINKIAIPDPQVAPYGRAVKELLELDSVWNELKSKLVFGESVAQVNHLLQLGAVDAALTSFSSSVVINFEEYICSEQFDEPHKPILQSVIKLNPNENSDKFYKFILGEKAQSILAAHGYESVR